MELAGRTFVMAQETTIKQDAYIMSRLRDMGITEMIEKFDPGAGSLNRFSQTLLLKAFDSGLLFEIMGGILVEPTVVWTPEVAAKNAVFFGDLRAKADKDALFGGVAQLLVDFLTNAVNLLNAHSRKSSGEEVHGNLASPAPFADPSSIPMASGTVLSGSLQSTTSTNMTGSPTGH